jgi:hypothetical protein
MMDLRHEIERRAWRFRRSDGTILAWLMQFAPDGSSVMHDHPNEARWIVDDDALLFHHEDGRVSTRFAVDREDDGRLHLAGRFLLDDTGTIHELVGRPPFDPSVPRLASCRIRTDLYRDTRALLVTLNGGGGCFSADQQRVGYELSGLAASLGADCIQVAEREDSCAAYADKTGTILDVIEGLLCRRYRTIVFAGFSSGGFGAILLAELFGARHPGHRIASVAVNAPTSLRPAHLDHLWKHVPARYLPPWVTPRARAVIPSEFLDPASLSRSHGHHGASHHLVYDRGNPAEAYYADILSGAFRSRLSGVDLGLTHGAGITALLGLGLHERIASDVIQQGG